MKERIRQIVLFVGLIGALLVVLPISVAFPAGGSGPVIVQEIPRRATGWSGAVAWYNGYIYEVADASSNALVKDPVTGETVGSIRFASWADDDTKGFTYDPFRGTFWVKVGDYAYEVAVTGGNYISRIKIQTEGFVFGIWSDPEEENVIWLADPVQPQVRKVNIVSGQTLRYVNTGFNVRGVVRVGETLWCTRAGEPGQEGILVQVDMRGNELCKVYLPAARYEHDAGGCEIDPEGYLWVHGGKGTAIYRYDVGGQAAPTPVPGLVAPVIDSGDYDGDGTSELAVFRPAAGLWAVKGVTRAYFGRAGDIPVPGDYNGDGTTDLAIFRPASGLWVVRGIGQTYFGAAGDIPVPGDYSGDGTVGPAVFRTASGLWAVRGRTRVYFGLKGDIPVPYYPCPGQAKEIAIFRPATGLWAVRTGRTYFGRTGDQPVIGFYGPEESGVGPAIFRPASGLWAVSGVARAYFGRTGDHPVPGNYSGAETVEIGIFRPASGLWAVKGVTRTYFGSSGDIPASGFAGFPSPASGW